MVSAKDENGNAMMRTLRFGRALKRTGVTLIVAGVIYPLAITYITLNDLLGVNDLILASNKFVIKLVFDFFPLLLIVAGAFVLWRGRQYVGRANAKKIITDPKQRVLYLRSFRSDASTWGNVFSLFVPGRLVEGLATKEEELADVLRPFGDLVAIGQPGEALPKPGAARIYAADAEWKEVVQGELRDARLVIIRAGVEENLLWELSRCVEILNPQKLLILIPNMNAERYHSFCVKANSVLGISLPEGRELERFGRVSGFIGFAKDWKPSFFPLRAPFFRRSVFKPDERLFKFALRPVFESFGLEWQPPPVSLSSVVATVGLAFSMLFLLYAFLV